MEKTMIKLNGRKLAKDDKEMIDSLFHSDGTCVGYYRVNKKTISILDHQKNKVGVINQHGCLCSARKVEKGYWYSFCTIDIIGEYESYIQSCEEPRKLLKELCK
jgi:hypothetical protein